VLAGSDANRPRRSDVDVPGLIVSIVVEDREPLVGPVTDVHIALMVFLYHMRIFVLDGACKEELHNALHGFLPRDFLAQLKKLPEISRPPPFPYEEATLSRDA
jgi:hypothetical protein